MNRRQLLKTFAGGGIAAALANRSMLWAQAPLELKPLGNDLTLLSGGGGNIAILTGPDGLLLIDSGLPDTAAAVFAKAASVEPGKVTVLMNTHWHYDHVGGNPQFGKSGAKIIAQENVKKRVSSTQHMVFMNRDVPALAAEGIPVETFTDKGRLKHGKEELHYAHLPPAHTDGDTTMHFQNANVFHTGDLMFNGFYPFIDYSSGGSIAGMAANAARMLKMVDGNTKIIPGHGLMATRADLQKFRDMLASVNEKVIAALKTSKTLKDFQAAAPAKDFDDVWGKGFMNPENFAKMLYMGETGKES